MGDLEWEREKFKKMFPNLYREIERGKYKIDIRKLQPDPWRGYQPYPEDFIARARNEREAMEIIDYLEKIKEISAEKARELRERLAKNGIDSFGERRSPGFYFRKAEERIRKEIDNGSEQ